jgi:hypothetical protein
MKRRALLGHPRGHGCVPEREGGGDSIWKNPQTGRKESVPRHNEIKKYLARNICRNLSVPVPPGD